MPDYYALQESSDGMTKYNISKEFGIFAKIQLPYNRFLFSFINLMLETTSKLVRSDKSIKITRIKIKTSDSKLLNLYLFDPLTIKTNQVLLYIHGGAFAYKPHKKHFDLCKKYAKDGLCKVILVDYRLLPKYTYPVPITDCFDAYKWIIENADTLNIVKDKIIIAGDSAGGCLAVDVTLKAIEKGITKPYYLMLIYPGLDKRMLTRSMDKFTDTPIWNSKMTKKMWSYYLKGKDYTSPNEVLDLSKMPNTYIETAEFDCLHDEGVDFANKLTSSGIKVILNETKNTMHGFDIKNCSITKEAVSKRIEILKSLIKDKK